MQRQIKSMAVDESNALKRKSGHMYRMTYIEAFNYQLILSPLRQMCAILCMHSLTHNIYPWPCFNSFGFGHINSCLWIHMFLSSVFCRIALLPHNWNTISQIPASDSRSWWRYQMVTFSALQALYAGNSKVTGELPSQRPVTRSFDVFFDLRLNKRVSKQSKRRWFWAPSRSLWHHCKVLTTAVEEGNLV